MAGIIGKRWGVVSHYSYLEYEHDYELINAKCDSAIKAINEVRIRELAELNKKFRAANPSESEIAKIPESQSRRIAEIVEKKVSSGDTVILTDLEKTAKKTSVKKTD